MAQLRNYRIPLSLICDLELVNFSFKTDLRIILTLERNINKLFESNKKVTAVPDNPDALIQFTIGHTFHIKK